MGGGVNGKLQVRPLPTAGFSLVELLVVIAILLLLISVLVPSFASLQESARRSGCLAHQRELSNGVQGYLADRNGEFFQVAWSPSDFSRFWMEAVRPYHAHSDATRMCPSTTSVETHGFRFTNLTAWSGKASPGSWINNGTRWHEGGFGINGWLYSTHGGGTTLGRDPWFAKVTRVKYPGQTPVFADCTWVDGWPSEHEQLTPGLRGVGAHVPGGSNSTARFGIARHGKAINMALVDGHVQKVPLEDLHQYYWRTDWSPHPLTLPAD